MNAACSSSRNCSGTPSAVRCRQGRGRFQGKAQPQLSEAQASAKVYADPANPRPLQLGLDLLVDLDHLADMTLGNASRPKVTCLMNPASKP